MKTRFNLLLYAVSLAIMATFPLAAVAGGSKHSHDSDDQDKHISKDAQAMTTARSVAVIITYKQRPDGDDENNIYDKQGKVGKVFQYLPLMAANLPGYSLMSVAHDPNVSYVSLDRRLRAHSAEYAAEPIMAQTVWSQGYDGDGIGIAVIDSGVSDKVKDLQGKEHTQGGVVYSASFVPSESTDDLFGHGTHVAGLIAGTGRASTGKDYFRTFKGVAPMANIVSLKALDANGVGTDSSVIAAIEAAIALKSTYNIRIINLSLGRPIFESYEKDPLCQAVEQAYRAGILVVAAAGNDGRNLNLNPEGYGTIESPGNDPYILTVGAMKTNGTPAIGDDTIASYSSKGPSYIDHISKPDLVAPGNLLPGPKAEGSLLSKQLPFVTLNSEYRAKGSQTDSSHDYLPLCGTSMAAAVTTGAAALLLEADPDLTPAQAKALLMKAANKNSFPLTSQVVADEMTYRANYDLFTVGAGYLDISAALTLDAKNQSKLSTGDALSPVAVFDAATNATYLVFSPDSTLGSTVLWGSTNVYGGQVLNRKLGTILWGSSEVTGASDPNGFSALWGASGSNAQTVLWGSSSPDATTILWGSIRGREDPTSSTILWGSLRKSPVLKGSNVPFEQ